MRRRARVRARVSIPEVLCGRSQVDEHLDHGITRDAAEDRHLNRYRHLLGVLFGLMRATANRVLIRRKTSTIAWYSLPSPRRFSPQSTRCPKSLAAPVGMVRLKGITGTISAMNSGS